MDNKSILWWLTTTCQGWWSEHPGSRTETVAGPEPQTQPEVPYPPVEPLPAYHHGSLSGGQRSQGRPKSFPHLLNSSSRWSGPDGSLPRWHNMLELHHRAARAKTVPTGRPSRWQSFLGLSSGSLHPYSLKRQGGRHDGVEGGVDRRPEWSRQATAKGRGCRDRQGLEIRRLVNNRPRFGLHHGSEGRQLPFLPVPDGQRQQVTDRPVEKQLGDRRPSQTRVLHIPWLNFNYGRRKTG